MSNVYDDQKEKMILRDFLATDRTILANERTFLAYVRTSISIIAAGVGFIKLFDNPIIYKMGYAFIPFGFIVLVFGVKRYIKVKNKLKNVRF
ncbi:DUF202 domain-containing protein [Abyssisolibacter fermentans]|uniref:DUF202 domain-containing protein n=1 Tax=Abyssisolibacter fermentans TaxID=1766203 RepID=UPI00083727F2|nr:DUF202 domain-containing protein [Abyssisolibacter fermentans]